MSYSPVLSCCTLRRVEPVSTAVAWIGLPAETALASAPPSAAYTPVALPVAMVSGPESPRHDDGSAAGSGVVAQAVVTRLAATSTTNRDLRIERMPRVCEGFITHRNPYVSRGWVISDISVSGKRSTSSLPHPAGLRPCRRLTSPHAAQQTSRTSQRVIGDTDDGNRQQ